MKMGLITAAVILCLYLGMGHIFISLYENFVKSFDFDQKFSVSSIDVSEARRHPRIMVAPPNAGPFMGLKKEYDFHEYEFQGGNAHPVDENTGEIGPATEGRGHGHEHEHHEHHDHIHIHHTKSISHHPKKHGYSAGSGLRSIAQGSADQASSAVSNQVSSFFIRFHIKNSPGPHFNA